MNNTHRTTDQGDRNRLPAFQFILNQHSDTIIDRSTRRADPEEYENYLANQNGHINDSGFMDPLTNSSNVSQTNLTNVNDEQGDPPLMIFRQPSDITTSEQIRIKFQPRQYYHPRTLKESQKTAFYLRCEDDDEAADYPTISVFVGWGVQSNENFIEVALVDMHNEPHPYIIDNKERNSPEGGVLIHRLKNAKNILWFRLTDDDFNNGFKTFKIELIKIKQDDHLTKELIRERKLENSRLRFTRIFLDKNGEYCLDKATTVYSSVMTERYGEVAVKYMNPTFGPMGGNPLLDVVCTGLTTKSKTKLSFQISEQTTGWNDKIKSFDSIGNVIHFSMPAFPFPRTDHVETSVSVHYEGHEIFKSSYTYFVGLDSILDKLNLNQPSQVCIGPTTSNSNDDCNQHQTGEKCSSRSVSKKLPKTNSRKRQRKD